MAVSANKIHLSGLARKLVVDGLLDEAAAQDHFQKSLKEKKPFVSYLVENNIVASSDIAVAAAQEFGVPLLDISSLELDMDFDVSYNEKTGKILKDKNVKAVNEMIKFTTDDVFAETLYEKFMEFNEELKAKRD